jgi:LPXTG-motif cell wall-anchored protein
LSFDNCTDAYAAGYANIPKGDPHYAAHLDRDGDGIACDTPPPGFEPHPSPTATAKCPPSPTKTATPTPAAPSPETTTPTTPPPATTKPATTPPPLDPTEGGGGDGGGLVLKAFTLPATCSATTTPAGELPKTGPAGELGAAGGALLVLGLVVAVLATRRRNRFTV